LTDKSSYFTAKYVIDKYSAVPYVFYVFMTSG